MESYLYGGIDAHLKDVREDTLRWRRYNDLIHNPSADKDGLLIQYLEGDMEAPEAPEALVLYYRLKTAGVPLVSGGYLAQPHLHLLEMEAVASAEREYQAQQVAQALIKEQANKAG